MKPDEDGVVLSRRALRQVVRTSFGGAKPEQIAGILRELDRGQLRRWSDLCAAMLADPVVRRGYLARRSAVTSRPVAVSVPAQVAPGLESAAKEAVDYAQRVLDRVPDMEAVMMRQLDAVGVGVAAHQVTWTRDGGQWWPEFEPVLTRDCYWHDSWSLAARDATGREVVFDQHPGRFWVTVPATQPGLPQDQGDFRAVVWFWLFKTMGVRFWLIASERYGTPLMLARVAATATAETRDEVLDDLARLSASSYGVIGGDAAIEVHDPKGVASADMWQRQVESLDRSILLALAGSPDLFMASPNGSRASTESRASIALETSRSDARVLWGSFIRDVIAHGLRFNGLEGAPLPVIETQFAGEESPIYAYHMQGGIVRRDELRARLGLPPLGPDAGGDELLDVGAQQPAMLSDIVGAQTIDAQGTDAQPPGGADAGDPFRALAPSDGMPRLRRTSTLSTTSRTSSRWRRRVSER